MQPTLLPLFATHKTQVKEATALTPKQRDEQLTKLLQEKTVTDPLYWSLPDRNRRQLAHSLFQYPAMMVPEVQRRLVEAIKSVDTTIKSLYDPFVGSGTALVAGMLNGLRCVGQDINPLAVLLARVKTQPYRYRVLKPKVKAVVKAARADKSLECAVAFAGLDKWFRPDVQRDLSRLHRAILSQPGEARPFLWVILAETIRLTSNDRTSTYKLHARTQEQIAARELAPLATFEYLATRGCEDLQAFHIKLAEAGLVVQHNVYRGEANAQLENTQLRAVGLPDEAGKYDLLVTSPPYGDNMTTVTYGQHSYLALNWIPAADIDPGVDNSLLSTTQEIDKRSLGGSLERQELAELVTELGKKSKSLAATLKKLDGSTVYAASSRVASFYRDLDDCLVNVLTVMKSNSYLCWTVANRRVGNVEIPIDKILIELLQAKRVKYVTGIERTIHYKRMASRNNTADTMKQERILIFRVL